MIDARSDAGEAVPANENSPKKPEIAPATIVALAVHYSGQTPSTRRWTCTCRPSSALAPSATTTWRSGPRAVRGPIQRLGPEARLMKNGRSTFRGNAKGAAQHRPELHLV